MLVSQYGSNNGISSLIYCKFPMHWAVQPTNQQATIDELCFPFLIDGSQGKKTSMKVTLPLIKHPSMPSPQCPCLDHVKPC